MLIGEYMAVQGTDLADVVQENIHMGHVKEGWCHDQILGTNVKYKVGSKMLLVTVLTIVANIFHGHCRWTAITSYSLVCCVREGKCKEFPKVRCMFKRR